MNQTEQQLRRTISLKRRAWAEQGLHNWITTYLVPPHSRLVRAEPAPFHRHLCAWYDRALLPGGGLISAIPRGHAKTTICTVGGSLFASLCEAPQFHKRNIVEVAKNQPEAKNKLRLITTELQRNKLIAEDYGDARLPLKDPWKNAPVANNDSEVILNNGTRLAIYPFMGPIRGQLHAGDRVDLGQFDDPEDDIKVKSPVWRNDAWNWITAAFLPSLDLKYASFMFQGTILHFDSMLNRCLRHDGFDMYQKVKLEAINPDGTVLWPSEKPYEILMVEKRKMGSAKFEQEYQNNPIADEDRVFKREWFRFFRRDSLRFISGCWHIDDGLTPQPRALMVFSGHDPAFTEENQRLSCFTGTATGGYDQYTNNVYLLRIGQEKLSAVDVLHLVVAEQQRWRALNVALEANLAQRALAQILQASTWVPIEPVVHNSTQHKDARIRGVAPFFERGCILLAADEPESTAFIDEALEYPASATKDRLDALAMMLQLVPFAVDHTADEDDTRLISFTSLERTLYKEAAGF